MEAKNKFEVSLKKYIDIFRNQEMYFVHDMKNVELFQKFSANSNIEDIRIKVSAINDKDINDHTLMDTMIAHIWSLRIDDRLKHEDLSLVEDIAHLTAHGKTFYFLHFASVYCNFHKPDDFPIFSDQHIEFYKRYIKENNLPLNPEKIDTYNVFSKALNDLVHRLGLTGKMNYLHLRKFGWLYAEKVVEEANA